MAVDTYKLDLKVFKNLQTGQQQLKDWKGKASGIADYVATWGVERFWAMSRSPLVRGGNLPDPNQGNEEQRSYFSWGVARVVLCDILGNELNISKDMPTANFQEQFAQLNFKQQVLLTDLLIEIAETIQFWTMRMNDANQSDV
ncbi:MAG: hypothetical protein BRC41_01200 [Cyanobacteria bacterium QH_9_48_43]|nr:MAG: hypothetical protein BRC41_01200 [Cyanobacteria bacterium QH_9_48_43]